MRVRVVMTAVVMLLVGAGTGSMGVAWGVSPHRLPSGPIIADSDIDNGGRSCSTATDPMLVLGYLANRLEAFGTDATLTTPSASQYTFAIWPVDDPAAETDIVDNTSSGSLGRATVPAGFEVSGSTYAWHVKMSDDNGTSPWSSTCLFTYDGSPPPMPTVTSPNFAENSDTWGPIGELAQFTFSGGGNPDIAGFRYGWGNLGVEACSSSGVQGQLVCADPLTWPDVVPADTPGGTATVALTPPYAGAPTLSVEAIDRAGNVSATVTYQISVPFSAPTITQINPPACGSQLQVSFTSHDGVTGVIGYSYSLDYGTPVYVSADSRGTTQAKIAVTRDNYIVIAHSVSANGFHSSDGYLYFVVDPQPTVTANVYVNSGQPVGGVGVTDTFTFTPPYDGHEVSGYEYRFTGGPSGIAPADPNTQNGSLTWAPTRPGPQTLTVSAINADSAGTSCALTYPFTVASGHH
jgi:hypothetical protein